MTVQDYNKTLETMAQLLYDFSAKLYRMKKDIPEPDEGLEFELQKLSDDLFNIQSRLRDCQFLEE
nr:MAG TPA: hypothetical protein [Caudoviricetes sp.]